MAGTTEHASRDIDFHRKTAATYDEETTREYGIYHDYALHPFLDRLYEPGMTAVDLGAGTGAVTLALAIRGFDVIAVDHSPEMIEIAKRKAQALGVEERIEFKRADVTGAGTPIGQVDLVTAQGVLHHLSDPADGVSALARALKPGGHFYISEPCIERSWLGKAIAAVFALLLAARRGLLRRPPNVAPPTVEQPISAAALLRSLRASGLEYDVEFITHLPRSHRWAGDRLRLRLTLLLSRAWSRKRGDIVFVRGRRPARPAAEPGAGA